MDKGHVSYSLDAFGNRQFETSELVRAYGAITSLAQPDRPHLAQVGTQEQWGTLLAEMQALRREIQELRAVVLMIEHKPDQPSKKSPSAPHNLATAVTWTSLCDSLDE